MQYDLHQQVFPVLTFSLFKGDQIYAQAGAMSWMDEHIQMHTSLKGGLFRAIGRKMTGNSMFLVTYTALRDDAQIGFTTNFIGSIIPIELHGESILVQKNGFLCAQPTIDIKTALVKRLSAGLWGGEGFILQQLSGHGLCFLEGSGNIFEKDLAPAQTIYVDIGNLLAFQQTVDYSIKVVKGFGNVLFAGEGLFLACLKGPGKVLLQTLTAQDIAQRLSGHILRKTKRS